VSELLARSAELRAEGRVGDGALWAASIALLGTHPLANGDDALGLARDAAGADAVDRALAAHAERFG
jgi:hypothetical protein